MVTPTLLYPSIPLHATLQRAQNKAMYIITGKKRREIELQRFSQNKLYVLIMKSIIYIIYNILS